MKPFKATKTSKLFFDKYVNKVTVVNVLAPEFRNNNLEYTIQALSEIAVRIAKSPDNMVYLNQWNKKVIKEIDVQHATLLYVILRDAKSSYAIRVEGSWLGIYSNDDALIDSIVSLGNIREISRPASTKVRDFLLTTPNSIISSKYTHKFKVTVNPLKETSANFHAWAEQIPTIKLLSRTYRAEGYFYAANEKTLGMCRLFLGNKLRRVDTLYLESEI